MERRRCITSLRWYARSWSKIGLELEINFFMGFRMFKQKSEMRWWIPTSMLVGSLLFFTPIPMKAFQTAEIKTKTCVNSLGSLYPKKDEFDHFLWYLGDPLGRDQNVNNPISFSSTDQDLCFNALRYAFLSCMTTHQHSCTLIDTH